MYSTGIITTFLKHVQDSLNNLKPATEWKYIPNTKTYKHFVKGLGNCKCIENINAECTWIDKIMKQSIIHKHITWERRNDTHEKILIVIDSS